MEMSKLFDKLDEGMESLKYLTAETARDYSITDCFPAAAFQRIMIDGQEYQMKIELTIKEI